MTIILIEAILIIPITFLWFQVDKRKIENDTIYKIIAGSIIIISLINWLLYAANYTTLTLNITSGFFGEAINISGITLAILPPIIINIISYLLCLSITTIQDYNFTRKRIKKEKGKK